MPRDSTMQCNCGIESLQIGTLYRAKIDSFRQLLSALTPFTVSVDAHPATEDSQLIHRVEGLRSARHFHDRQRFALGRPHGAKSERNPINLRFHNPGHCAVALG